ncbi:SDR family NAD(P)-dependent oxidoreductase [Pseudoalteromonas sp. SR44-5]|uniref:SDR family NAD(P)-dependent oxidoreductase n=1 Tax=unclassified Pseudoalteromonas TaxID=194690 RepID=UPI0016038693|nr:SDR family NAD(P)-dependent oxidoreductase [Pseudoalteromonas sp. SR44-5]MBB1365768.1 SDR family NAD(P)-dependent oxidoreductase [Pseudoalteromonas sp. SR44-5]
MTNAYIIFGASSEIANAYLKEIAKHDPQAMVFCVSRSCIDTSAVGIAVEQFVCDYSKARLSELTNLLKERAIYPTQVVIFNGQLHYAQSMPEKKLDDIDEHYFNTLLNTNTLTPILCLQAIAPLLSHKIPCTITALSARVGSITDNNLGGWYSYRASKAALNMLFKTAAIELQRRAKQTRLILFHPGTTDTNLSKPFQKNVPAGKLFTPEFVASQLYTLLQQPEQLTEVGQPAYIDWQGEHIHW